MPNQTKYASYVETSFAGGGSGVWSNPQNAESSDNLYAVAVCNEATSEFLLFRGFFFSLPTNVTIDGFEVGIERHANGVAIFDETVRLVKGGAVAGDSSADTVNPWSIGADQTVVYGGSDQLWGETWTRQNVNSSGFGAVLTAENLLVGDGTASVDSLYVTVHYHFEEVASGGSSVGGVAIVDPWVMVGGVQLGGVAASIIVDMTEVSGGVQVSGSVTHSFSKIVGGGIEIGGSAPITSDPSIVGSGGVEVGGFAGRTTHDIVDVEGGVSAGGTSPSLSFYAPLEGVKIGGESTVLSSIVTSGGVSVSGENHSGGVHNLSGEGGVKPGGEVNESGVIHRTVVADGGVEVDQEPDAHLLLPTADYGITGRSISSTGGVYVTNVNDPTIINYRFELNKTFLWHLRTYLVKDLTFFWSTGLLIIYWYRVVAKPIEDCDCCKKVITNVHARTVAELCEKLSERNWTWPIDTIEKFRRPAALGNAINGWENQQEAIDDYDLESSALENCHDLESIEFCEIPQCANYCIDFDLRVSFSFDMSKYSVNAFHDYESGDGESEDRAIRISGDADTTHFRIIPDFPYESNDYGADPDGNETDPQRMAIEISGSAVAWSSHQRSDGGGILTAVEAHTSFTNWQFIGGVWPFVVTASPSIAESVSSLNQEGSVIEGDQPWLSLNNALLPDGSDASTDISWGENSEFLVLRGFRLNIPLVGPKISQVVKIDRIQVHIDRWTTQVGTEDLRFFLVSGDEVISNNIEQTDFRWPLIPTMITYGDDPTSFEPNQNRFRNIDELVWNPWDINVLNSADFGVAIQVHDVVGAGGTFGRVDHITLEVTYDYVEHQTLRTGGSARQISSAYNHTSDGSIQVGGKVDTYTTWNYLPNAIGLGQPTSVVFGGGHAMALSYIVPEQNTLWLDAGNPVDEANTGVVAYWTNDATNQPLSDFLDGTFDSSAQWQDATNANVADIKFAYIDISPDDLDSDFLVVRNLGLNLGEHWKVHGIRVIMGLRGTRSSEDDSPGDPPIFGGGTIEGSGGIRVSGGWTVGGVRVSGVADETFEDVTDVRDRYVYLVRGDNIISDNLAKDLPWPAFPGYNVAYYGSTGFDGEPQFRDQDLSPWDVEEINDSKFGVAIAVSNLGVTVDTVAEIDGIAIELTVEAFGRILTVSSHVNLLGSSGAYPDHQPGRGGMVVGGEGEVKPFWDEVDGGTSVDGKSIVQQHFFYDVTADGTTEIEGSIVIGGGAFATDTIFDHVANGGCGVSGLAKEEFSRQIFVSDGNAIFILGGAEIRATSAGSVTVSMQADMQIIDFQGIFSEDVDEQDIETITDEVSQCGCLTIPMFVTLEHNILERNNIFVQFLARNNFFMSRTIELSHNVPNDSWQANFHYRGLSSDSNTEEKWDFVFELQCTNMMGSIDIGRNVWKLAISVFRENLITGEDFDTRIVIGLMPEPICDTNANELEFDVSFNTQTNVATVIPEDAIVYQSTLFDNIGLFKTSSWVSYPELVLSISQSGFSEPQQRVDLYDAVVIGEGPPLPSS